jgi:hypothetical protein
VRRLSIMDSFPFFLILAKTNARLGVGDRVASGAYFGRAIRPHTPHPASPKKEANESCFLQQSGTTSTSDQ